jgi:hypothetical protein
MQRSHAPSSRLVEQTAEPGVASSLSGVLYRGPGCGAAKLTGGVPMSEYVPPPGEANPNHPCERCNGQHLVHLTRLPKRFDTPAFDIFRCDDCGRINWVPLKE